MVVIVERGWKWLGFSQGSWHGVSESESVSGKITKIAASLGGCDITRSFSWRLVIIGRHFEIPWMVCSMTVEFTLLVPGWLLAGH